MSIGTEPMTSSQGSTPTSPAPDDSRGEDDVRLVEKLAAEFLAAVSGGEEPDLDSYLEQLSSVDERAQLKRLMATAKRLDARFPARLKPGLLLNDRYRLESVVGAGGMGQVWRAHDTHLDREVAVKSLSPAGISSVEAEPRFKIESQTLGRLKHPNIVVVHDSGEDGEIRYLVMDLVDGTPLDQVLANLQKQQLARKQGHRQDGSLLREAIDRELPPGMDDLIGEDSWYRIVSRIMVEILHTLEAAHGAGVLHRDIKPGNLLLRAGGRPMLLDFGLCGAVGGGAGDFGQGLYGTHVYLAPEQVKTGRVGSSVRTDIYQLGAVFYELLTLQRAITADQTAQVLKDIEFARFRTPCEVDGRVPVELEDICLKAMELVAQRRYASAQAFREDLERFLGGTEIPHAARHRGVRSLRYFGRRHRLKLFVAAAVLLGGSLGALLLYEQPGAVISQAGVEVLDGGKVVGTGVRLKLRREQAVFVLTSYLSRNGERFYVPMRLQLRESDTVANITQVKAIGNGIGLILPIGEHTLSYNLRFDSLPPRVTIDKQVITAGPDTGQRHKLEQSWRRMNAELEDTGLAALPRVKAVALIAALDEASRDPDPVKDAGFRGLTAAWILEPESRKQDGAESHVIQQER